MLVLYMQTLLISCPYYILISKYICRLPTLKLG